MPGTHPFLLSNLYPDSKVHWANMGPTWGRQDPGGPHVGHVNLAIWVVFISCSPHTLRHSDLDFCPLLRGYGGRWVWAGGDCCQRVRGPRFKTAASRTIFLVHLECVLLPVHRCLQCACVSTTKIPSKVYSYHTYCSSRYQWYSCD